MSPDLRHARVYVSILGEEEQKEEIVGSTRSGPVAFSRRKSANACGCATFPELRFTVDETLDHAERIESLLEGTTDRDGAGDTRERRGRPRMDSVLAALEEHGRLRNRRTS